MIRGLVRATYAPTVRRRSCRGTDGESVVIGVVATSSFGSAWRVPGDSSRRPLVSPNRRWVWPTLGWSADRSTVCDPRERGPCDHEDPDQPQHEAHRPQEHRDLAAPGEEGRSGPTTTCGRRHHPGPRGGRRAEDRQRAPGHRDEPGAVAYLLFQNVMAHDPSDPTWLGRDRFVLSCGHSSLTQYIQLYLSGYGLELEGPQGAAHVGLADPRPPRGPPHQGCRDHDRPAGLGPRLGRRHGDGPAPPARPARPRRQARPSPFDHHV